MLIHLRARLHHLVRLHDMASPRADVNLAALLLSYKHPTIAIQRDVAVRAWLLGEHAALLERRDMAPLQIGKVRQDVPVRVVVTLTVGRLSS